MRRTPRGGWSPPCVRMQLCLRQNLSSLNRCQTVSFTARLKTLVLRDLKLDSDEGPRPELAVADFIVSNEILAWSGQIRALRTSFSNGDGGIMRRSSTRSPPRCSLWVGFVGQGGQGCRGRRPPQDSASSGNLTPRLCRNFASGSPYRTSSVLDAVISRTSSGFGQSRQQSERALTTYTYCRHWAHRQWITSW
jgi:hypothetical protein